MERCFSTRFIPVHDFTSPRQNRRLPIPSPEPPFVLREKPPLEAHRSGGIPGSPFSPPFLANRLQVAEVWTVRAHLPELEAESHPLHSSSPNEWSRPCRAAVVALMTLRSSRCLSHLRIRLTYLNSRILL